MYWVQVYRRHADLDQCFTRMPANDARRSRRTPHAVPDDESRSPVAAVTVSTLVAAATATASVLFEHTATAATTVVVAATTTATTAVTAATTTAAAAEATTTTAAAIAAATATATTAAIAATTAAATTLLTRPGFVDGQGSPIEIFAIECFDRSSALRIVHLDEAEASGTTGLPIRHQVDTLHFTMRREEFSNLFLVG